jgi:hypothetical protein
MWFFLLLKIDKIPITRAVTNQMGIGEGSSIHESGMALPAKPI